MDLTPRCSPVPGSEVTRQRQPLCHIDELQASNVLLPDLGSTSSSSRYLPAGLAESASVCFSSFSDHTTNLEQDHRIEKFASHFSFTYMETEGVVSRPSEPLLGTSYPSGHQAGLLRQPHFHRVHLNPQALHLHV